MTWKQAEGRICRLLVCLAMAWGITACGGWRLQGAFQLPPELSPVYVQDSGSGSRLGYELRDQLRLAQVAQTDTPKQAKAVIVISGDRIQRQLLAVDSSGKGRDYAVILRADYDVLQAGKPLQPRRSVQRRRDYLVSELESDPLTDELRALEITDALRREVAREILRQLTIQAEAQL
ncbi:MAG TPA: LPS assembly lipoprotein LptE [Candidatus Macondimonas sp.]|nr:LPS assembly lipoprotein LptE [Candidatus Macondimonas sp.]